MATDTAGPLFKMRWYRVVLDEAHFIRNKSTQASKAVWDLDALYRWSLTGTLINNSLDDIYPHLRFLGISPQQDYNEFSKMITKVAKKQPVLAAKRAQVSFIYRRRDPADR
jgi:SNF2 family DNA or RNA helicase